MEQNQFNPENKINAELQETRVKIESFFDDKDKLNEAINQFISQAEVFEKHGFISNKEKIIDELRQSFEIKDREEFVDHLMKIAEPIIRLRLANPKLFSKVERETTFANEENLKLSEVLYITKARLNEDSEEIFIHLTSARDFMTKENKNNFILEIKKGLKELAKLIKGYPNIKSIRGNSWIIATKGGAKRMEELGFTLDGPITEEEREQDFPDEEKPVAKAFMNREDFLAIYGN